MAVMVENYLDLIPALEQAAADAVWVDYDRVSDVLYVNFRMPAEVDDSDEVEPDVIAHYAAGGELTGYTILNASRQMRKAA
jgi:uncharacterized protein YuzE